MHTYYTPFGVVVSQQNPDAMHLRPIGGVQVHRPRIEAELEVRQRAEGALRSRYAAGQYTESKEINAILHSHFQFYDVSLKQEIPHLASRHFMEFVLHQYDLSCKIDKLFKNSSLKSDDHHFWCGMGYRWRRALKYLAECTCMLAATEESPAANLDDILGLTDRVMIYAEQLVQTATLSDQTYMLFPESTRLQIASEGSLDYFDLEVDPEIGSEFQKRVHNDLNARGKFIALDYPLFAKSIRAETLNEAFAQVFGLTYEECFTLLFSIMDNVVVADGGFPIPFVLRHQLITNAAGCTGASETSVARLLDGFTVSRTRMTNEDRKVWKPKQEHRAYRRGFFDFPHEAGQHLTWSDGMAKECALMLLRDLAFQHLPPEWDEPPIRAALAELSNRCGKEFEKVCIRLMEDRGYAIASSFKDGIGIGDARIAIPDSVGELDCLGYAPTASRLVLLECKLVQSGTEAARFRDDIHQFTNAKDGYYCKFQRKLEWVRNNTSAISRALQSLPDAPDAIQPTQVSSAIVTLYPSIASYFNPPAPCVSVGELFSAWDDGLCWPHATGLFAP